MLERNINIGGRKPPGLVILGQCKRDNWLHHQRVTAGTPHAEMVHL